MPADVGQLTRTGLRAPPPDIIDAFRSECSHTPYVRFEQFVEPWLPALFRVAHHRLRTRRLRREPFAGGHLQIADASLTHVLFDAPNRGFGDAVLCRLSEDLKHRVSELEPGPLRTVFTGWFVRQPSYADWLRGADVKSL